MNLAKECEHVTRFIVRGITGDDTCLPQIEKSIDDQPFAGLVQYIRSTGVKNNSEIVLLANKKKKIVSALLTEERAVIYDPFTCDKKSFDGKKYQLVTGPSFEVVKRIKAAELLAFMVDPSYCHKSYMDVYRREQSMDQIERLVFRVLRTAICELNKQPNDVLFVAGSGRYAKQNGLEIANILNTITSNIDELHSLSVEHDYQLAVYELHEPTRDYDTYIVWPICKNQRMLEHSGKGYLCSNDLHVTGLVDFRNFGTEIFLHSVPAYYKEIRRYRLADLIALLRY